MLKRMRLAAARPPARYTNLDYRRRLLEDGPAKCTDAIQTGIAPLVTALAIQLVDGREPQAELNPLSAIARPERFERSKIVVIRP